MGPRGSCCVMGMLLFLGSSSTIAQDSSDSAQTGQKRDQPPPDPVLAHRPPPKQPSAAAPDTRLFLDVMVNDAAGKPQVGLQPWDFKVTDDGRPAKILSFRSFGAALSPNPPVEVILVIDELNLPFAQVSFVKNEIAEFLSQNGGRLAQPVSIAVVTEAGVQLQTRRPSTNGIALLDVLNQMKPHLSGITPAMGVDGLLTRSRISIRQLAALAENEAPRPGRKLLIWVGPGWPMLQSQNFRFSEQDGRRNFSSIVELTNRLREARIVVYSVAPLDAGAGVGPSRAILYQEFLKGIRTEKQADIGNLGLKVLVNNTGGRILGPGNDIAQQMNQCIADANGFYQISFDPPRAEHVHEYHELKVEVNQPGLTVRTNSGYYNEPPGF